MTLPPNFSQETRVVHSPSSAEKAVGVDELISGNTRVRTQRKRSERRRRAAQPKQGFFRTLIQVMGELLITAGVILLLFRCVGTVVDKYRSQYRATGCRFAICP